MAWAVSVGGSRAAKKRWPRRIYKTKASAKRRVQQIHAARDMGVATIGLVRVAAGHGDLSLHTYRSAVSKHLQRTYDVPASRANDLAASEPGYIAYARRRHVSPSVAASAIAAKHHRYGGMKLGLRRRRSRYGNTGLAATAYYRGREIQIHEGRGGYFVRVLGTAGAPGPFDTIREATEKGKRIAEAENPRANYRRRIARTR